MFWFHSARYGPVKEFFFLVFYFLKNIAVLWCQSYLQPGNHQLMNGVNFASAGTGALVETHQGKVRDLID
jgi:hypothetical protein